MKLSEEFLALRRHTFITYGQLLEELQKLGPDELLRPVIVSDDNGDVETVQFLWHGKEAWETAEQEFQSLLVL